MRAYINGEVNPGGPKGERVAVTGDQASPASLGAFADPESEEMRHAAFG